MHVKPHGWNRARSLEQERCSVKRVSTPSPEFRYATDRPLHASLSANMATGNIAVVPKHTHVPLSQPITPPLGASQNLTNGKSRGNMHAGIEPADDSPSECLVVLCAVETVPMPKDRNRRAYVHTCGPARISRTRFASRLLDPDLANARPISFLLGTAPDTAGDVVHFRCATVGETIFGTAACRLFLFCFFPAHAGK